MDVTFLEEQAPTFHQRTNKPRQGVGRSVAKSSDRCGETNESSSTAATYEHTGRLLDSESSELLGRLSEG